MKTTTPQEDTTLRALAALSQVQRLRAFRELVVAGPEGMTPGTIAERMGMSPSALSFHLKELARAELVNAEPRGRHLIYRANFERMNGLLGYLTEHCCAEEPCEVAPTCTRSVCGETT